MPNKTLIIIALIAALLIAGLGIINYRQKTQTNNSDLSINIEDQVDQAQAASGSPAASAIPSNTNIENNNNSTMNLNTQPQIKNLDDFADAAQNPAQQVTLVTTKGEITFKLFREAAPLTTANFIDLASNNFYDGIVFHRVIADFMAQAGDPLTKDETQKALWGTSGPGYKIEDEFNPELTHSKPGIVSMANTGQPNTGGSQFFITYEATPWLDNKHAVFGEVTDGMDVLDQIEVGDKILSVELK